MYDPDHAPSLSSPHLQLLEALEFPIDLVEIKGLRIKLPTDPFQHLLVLGVLRVASGHLSVGDLVARAIRYTHLNESVSSLFD